MSNKYLSKEQKAVIKKQIAKTLREFYNNDKIAFGKHKDKNYEELPLYYLQWIMRTKDNYIKEDTGEYLFID